LWSRRSARADLREPRKVVNPGLAHTRRHRRHNGDSEPCELASCGSGATVKGRKVAALIGTAPRAWLLPLATHPPHLLAARLLRLAARLLRLAARLLRLLRLAAQLLKQPAAQLLKQPAAQLLRLPIAQYWTQP
jgi:hypothetical protein